MKQQASRLTLIFCISIATPVVGQSAKCTIRDLPKGIAETIISKYPGWIPEQISDLGPDDQALWVKAHGNICPSIASGHFQSNSCVTYAVLLLKKDPPRLGYKFLLFNENPSGRFMSILLDQAEGKNAGQPVISCVPPGEYSDPET